MLKRILTYSGIILLNFTGLGLGFLALGRWNRWRAHLMLTLGLFLLAIMMRAYQSPLAWTVVASAWVLVTALEACLLVQSSNWKPAGWLVFLLGVAACGLTAAARTVLPSRVRDRPTPSAMAIRAEMPISTA